MGLDVYLYRYEDFDRAIALEAEAEAHSEQVWSAAGEYSALDDETKERLRAEIAAWNAERGLDEWGAVQPPAKVSIALPSARWPDHLFKVGYFRSSYNDSGFNRVAGNLVGKDLAWVFGVTRDDYRIKPDWRAASERAQRLADELTAQPNIGAFDVSPTKFFDPVPRNVDTAAAMVLYKEQAASEPTHGGGWSNRDGHFFPHKPLEVLALINGVDCFKHPAIIVVHKKDLSSYVQSARIVAETCQYVLDTGEPEKHVLHWSD